jgi:hypothetical protein
MRVFDGVLGVLDGQFWIASDNDDIGPDMFAAFVGQRNGLLGAAEDAQLRLITGAADGDVSFSVHVVESEPQLDGSWEDCVEASFTPRTPAVGFFDWDGNVVFEIPLGDETYRVRYAARAMDAGSAGTEMDSYALWFWPAPPAPDAIVKQTSESAAYWHAEIARINSLS